MKNICVYCASSSKVDSKYLKVAEKLGTLLAKNDLQLVYGGGSAGLMGVLADNVLISGGKAVGVIPKFMVDAEWQHDGLTELILTETMHERKEKNGRIERCSCGFAGRLRYDGRIDGNNHMEAAWDL